MTRISKSKALLTINLKAQHVNGMTHCVKGVKGANIIYSCKVSSQLFTSWARFYGVAKGEHLQADDVVEIKVQQYSSFATTYNCVNQDFAMQLIKYIGRIVYNLQL